MYNNSQLAYTDRTDITVYFYNILTRGSSGPGRSSKTTMQFRSSSKCEEEFVCEDSNLKPMSHCFVLRELNKTIVVTVLKQMFLWVQMATYRMKSQDWLKTRVATVFRQYTFNFTQWPGFGREWPIIERIRSFINSYTL